MNLNQSDRDALARILFGGSTLRCNAHMVIQGAGEHLGHNCSTGVITLIDTPQVNQGVAELWMGELIFRPSHRAVDKAGNCVGKRLESLSKKYFHQDLFQEIDWDSTTGWSS